jgi:hypothetical protein
MIPYPAKLYTPPPDFPLQMIHTRGSRFLNYNFLQFAVDGKNNSKTKVEKVFFFIVMSSYAEMSFREVPKKSSY